MHLNVFGWTTWSLEVFLSPLIPCRSTPSSDLPLFISTTMSSLLTFSLVLRTDTVTVSALHPHAARRYIRWWSVYSYALYSRADEAAHLSERKTYRSCFPERPHGSLPFLYMKYSTLPRMASSKMKMMMIAMMNPLPPGGTNKKVQAAGYKLPVTFYIQKKRSDPSRAESSTVWCPVSNIPDSTNHLLSKEWNTKGSHVLGKWILKCITFLSKHIRECFIA